MRPQVIVPRRVSGGHKDIQEIDLNRKRVNARHVKISLRGHGLATTLPATGPSCLGSEERDAPSLCRAHVNFFENDSGARRCRIDVRTGKGRVAFTRPGWSPYKLVFRPSFIYTRYIGGAALSLVLSPRLAGFSRAISPIRTWSNDTPAHFGMD